jgi:isopenicillin N synthase-like dioxygenase
MKVALVDYRHPEAAHQFEQSLKNTGFAVIRNHPLSQDLIRQVFADWKAYFQTEAKFKDQFDPKTQAGYFPFKSENAKDNKIKDLKEFFHLFTESPLPSGMPNNTKVLYQQMSDFAIELLGWIQKCAPESVRSGFSIPLTEMIQGSKETLLRPIHYPPLDGTEEAGAIRAAAHEDINLITILPAASAPGLEVKDVHGNWHQVECNPGDLAINSGDMLQMASGGYYISTTHRVVNPHGGDTRQPRYSMPLFLHPRADVRLGKDHTAKSYLEERLREIGLLKKGESKA